jgi:hypothetical protein
VAAPDATDAQLLRLKALCEDMRRDEDAPTGELRLLDFYEGVPLLFARLADRDAEIARLTSKLADYMQLVHG